MAKTTISQIILDRKIASTCRHSVAVVHRFMQKISIDPSNGCWNWTGCIGNTGYGQACIENGIRKYAHVLAYEIFIGPKPKGLDLDHLCRNRRCVNPSHLEPVTRRENLMRGNTIPARKAAQTHCKRGHPLEGDNLYITSNGTRSCRICKDANYKKWLSTHRERRREIDRDCYHRKKERENV